MSGDGSTPGNGSTNPFGNGAGGTRTMASGSNNFLTRPAGANPNSGRGQPESYGKSRPQSAGQDSTRSTADSPPGPDTAAQVATPSPGGDIGTIAGNAVHKPFKLGA
jgi:hypothetical protein